MLTFLGLYNDDIPTYNADRDSLSMPVALFGQLSREFFHPLAQRDHERFDALESAGFNVERYGDLASTLYERGGRHYIDVGVSAKIARGLVSPPPKILLSPVV